MNGIVYLKIFPNKATILRPIPKIMTTVEQLTERNSPFAVGQLLVPTYYYSRARDAGDIPVGRRVISYVES
jgi:hypothetical protein